MIFIVYINNSYKGHVETPPDYAKKYGIDVAIPQYSMDILIAALGNMLAGFRANVSH